MTPIAPIHTRHAAMTAGVTAALLLASAAAIAGDAPAAGPSITAVHVGSGFSQPLFVDAPPPPLEGQPADDRLFVVEKTGRIRILHPATGTIEPTAFLDIAAQITTNSERGLLGLAFDADFRQADNRYFYVNYTDLNGDTVIARYQVSATDPNLADLDSFTQITAFEQDFENHNGGSLAFGPDGMLYVATGDGGSGNDPNRRAQDLDYLLGKILRFDVNNEAGDFIPADNPYVGSTGRDEIWAVGLRNPFRISFDRLTGDLYIGDVGQDRREEINWQPAHAIGSMPGQGGYQGGRNYGWRCREGTVCTGLSQCT